METGVSSFYPTVRERMIRPVYDSITISVIRGLILEPVGKFGMNRRKFLTILGAGSAVLTAGCSSVLEESGPFHFGITNWREQAYTAELILHKNSEEVISGQFDIASNNIDDEDPAAIYLQGVTEVKNGDVINAQVTLDGETYRGSYEVTCNRRDASDYTASDPHVPENNFFLYIHSGDPGEIEYGGSECG